MKKYFIALGIVIIGSIIWFSVQSYNSGQQNQFQCADAAAKYFQSFSSDNPGNSQFEYTDHWNGTLNKCFILTKTTTMLSTGPLEASALVDVLENQTYGLMGVINGSFYSCSITPGGQNSQPCNFQSDFETYANRLMTR